MNKTFKNSVIIGLTMFGTLVGAGFASGKEIWFYFARFGGICYVMIFLTCLLFFLFSLLFFKFGKKFNITTVQKCNKVLFKKFSSVFEVVFIFSNILLLSSMFAGADSLFGIFLPNLKYRLFSVITAIITIVVVCTGFKGVKKTNLVVVPLLILVVLIILLFSFFSSGKIDLFVEQNQINLSLIYSILYVGSNMFFAGFIFAKIGSEHTTKELFWGGFLGSVLLFLSLLGITFILFLNPMSVNSDMPVVYVSANFSTPLAIIVLCVVWLGLLTTAFALLFTISSWLETYFGNKIYMCLIASILALSLSGIGFSSFVKIVYPSMSVFGFLYIILIMFNLKKHKKLLKNNF
ncbi:MAG: hypothetical protein IJ837_02615 [Clostridia bacterium]|nr:hypothetical protein [Clostridia bacterium]